MFCVLMDLIGNACHGWVDCVDSEDDELDCMCQPHQFWCNSTCRCINHANLCDGVCGCKGICEDEVECPAGRYSHIMSLMLQKIFVLSTLNVII